MAKVKICGIKRGEDVDIVNSFMPDYVGFVFAESKRKVSVEEAQKLILGLNPQIRKVGVFVNESYARVISIAKILKLDVLQFHGDEGNEYLEKFKTYEVWKAASINSKSDIEKVSLYNVNGIVVDSLDGNGNGGTGKKFDWSILKKYKNSILKPIFVAGGLNEENIQECIKELQPFGVDVSSGVESNGVKDKLKIKNFITKVRNFK
ncbi:phosphoribosylanthranilate isomerase [Clostridium hydrogenum]|uniref:phosphoribosylanthranilate isomerase n=1 Tax=Clostridium hydrogenum TaxID=2855764 RepID=UPI001F2B2EC7|nr:phosphoribosylanthranilate isomerase [Clostridium hydrogenum]